MIQKLYHTHSIHQRKKLSSWQNRNNCKLNSKFHHTRFTLLYCNGLFANTQKLIWQAHSLRLESTFLNWRFFSIYFSSSESKGNFIFRLKSLRQSSVNGYKNCALISVLSFITIIMALAHHFIQQAVIYSI